MCVCGGVIFLLFAIFYWQARLAWAPPAALFRHFLPSFGVGSGRTPRPAPPVAPLAPLRAWRGCFPTPGCRSLAWQPWIPSFQPGSGRTPWSPVSSFFRVQDFPRGPGPPTVFSILFFVLNSFLARQGTYRRLQVFTLDGVDEGK